MNIKNTEKNKPNQKPTMDELEKLTKTKRILLS